MYKSTIKSVKNQAGNNTAFFRQFVSLVVLFLLISQNLSFAVASNVQFAPPDLLISNSIVISQFQVAGGTATDEFVELHNISSGSVDLNGLRLVYRSASGTNDVLMIEWTTSTVIQAGGYYLIATSAYDGTVPSNINYNTGTVSMAAAGGGLAIRSGTGTIIDSVGYGTATNIFVEGTATTAPAANASKERSNGGCADTDNNAADFSTVNPSAPRNSSSAVNVCSGGGTPTPTPTVTPTITPTPTVTPTPGNLSGTGLANPATVNAGAMTLLTVNVTPATEPPSTGIIVTGNLSTIGGSAAQIFFDNGTNGDVTANDNIFSFRRRSGQTFQTAVIRFQSISPTRKTARRTLQFH
jgi:predicted extracellular nuclease